jgi:hypothetical protein
MTPQVVYVQGGNLFDGSSTLIDDRELPLSLRGDHVVFVDQDTLAERSGTIIDLIYLDGERSFAVTRHAPAGDGCERAFMVTFD